ncbi:MAG: hypothetical protein FWG51_01315, partial [Firmicutes bacterium]|nr:hypothetical protein [Bacillota bacterium]
MRRKIFICLVATLLLVTAIIPAVGLLNFKDKEASAASANASAYEKLENGDFDSYTDTDTFNIINGTTPIKYSIQDYKRSLYRTKLYIDYDYNSYAFYCISAGEDPITKIVPKDLFMEVGTYLHIGKEYGFFVKTIKTTDYSNYSTVMVFDIITNLNYNNNTDKITSEVKVLFQYNYLYLTETNNRYRFKLPDRATYGNLSNEKTAWNPNGNIVIPAPHFYQSTESHPNIGYVEEDKYCLADIGFTLNLINNEYLNPCDSNYRPENDNGNFVTRIDYAFDGVTLNKPSPDWSALADSVMVLAGKVPILGTVIDVTTFSLNMTHFITSFFQDPTFNVNVSHDNNSFFTESFYTTKEGQINNNGFLNKTAVSYLGTGNTSFPLIFNSDNWARGTFTVSRTENVSTKVCLTTLLTIREMEDRRLVANSYPPKGSVIHAENYGRNKIVNLNENNNVIIFNRESNDYYFTPQISGNYTLTGSSALITKITGNFYENGNIIKTTKAFNETLINISLLEGQEYKITVSLKTEKFGLYSFDIIFAPEKISVEKPYNGSLYGNSNMVFELEGSSSPYLIQTSGKNTTVLVIDKNFDVISDSDYFSTGENAYINALFKSTEKYYIYVGNNNSSPAIIDVQVNAPKELALNSEDALPLKQGDNYYYKFTPKFSGNYTFGTSLNGVVSLYDKDLDLLVDSNQKTLGHNFVANSTYYLKVKSNANGNFIQKAEFSVNTVNFGDNVVYYSEPHNFYSFTTNFSGEYNFSINNVLELLLYDADLNYIKSVKNTSAVLNEGKYYIGLQNTDYAQANLNISINTTQVEANINYSLYFNT